jgi:hypothetical protein
MSMIRPCLQALGFQVQMRPTLFHSLLEAIQWGTAGFGGVASRN